MSKLKFKIGDIVFVDHCVPPLECEILKSFEGKGLENPYHKKWKNRYELRQIGAHPLDVFEEVEDELISKNEQNNNKNWRENMSEQQDTTLAVKKEPVSEIQVRAREFAQRLKYMIVNGHKLSDEEVWALAQYAASTRLDPLAQECWYIPGKGPCPGIAGWRTKGQEQLEYEAKTSGEKDPGYFWVDYQDADPKECIFDPAKDIAYKVILRDSRTQKIWRDSLKETIQMLRDSLQGFNATAADFWKVVEESKKLIGPEPVWTGYGVVFGTENFPPSFDRRERAKKRGEKLSIKKRFPRIHLPEPEGYEDTPDTDNMKVVMAEPEKITSGKPTDQLVGELMGETKPTEPDPIEGQFSASELFAKEAGAVEITPTSYYTLAKQKNIETKDAKLILEKNGGDFAAAYSELKGI